MTVTWDVSQLGYAVKTGSLQFQQPSLLWTLGGAAVIVLLLVVWLPQPGKRFWKRAGFFLTRGLVAALLVMAVAGPFTAAATIKPGDPSVTVLMDRSASMDMVDVNTSQLVTGLRDRLPVTVKTIGGENRSRLGDELIRVLRPDTHYLLVSDGQVTAGTGLREAATFYRQGNASLSAVETPVKQGEASVAVHGPETATKHVANKFFIDVDTTSGDPVPVSVTVDSETVREETTADGFTVEHVFTASGSHTVTAHLQAADRWRQNNVFHRTVDITDPPPVLYVGSPEKPVYTYLSELYNVTHRDRIPDNVSAYYATVIANQPAADITNVDVLHDAVVQGDGLVVVGGYNAFDRGQYRDAPVEQLLPVSVTGETEAEGGANIVFLIDRSGSTEDFIKKEKELAVSAVNSIDIRHTVGAAALGTDTPDAPVPVISPMQPLAAHKHRLTDRISRLTFDGVAFFTNGLDAARQMLAPYGAGHIIVISDGVLTGYNYNINDVEDAVTAAERLAGDGFEVTTIQVGSHDPSFLQRLADAGDGVYLSGDEHKRLNLLFGEVTQEQGQQLPLAVVDSHHFITRGLTLSTAHSRFNSVEVKPGADTVVMSSGGVPSIAAWRFGVGRVATFTTFTSNGDLGTLLSRDGAAVTRTVNWAVGHPERKNDVFIHVADGRVGEDTLVEVRSDKPPQSSEVRFTQTGVNSFTGAIPAQKTGRYELFGEEYAVNYRREYEDLGQSAAVEKAVQETGGDMFAADDYEGVAEHVRELSERRQVNRLSFTSLFIVAALILYFMEVAARRVYRYRDIVQRRGDQ